MSTDQVIAVASSMSRMGCQRRLGLASLGGVALASAYPPLDLPVLAVVGVAAFAASVWGARARVALMVGGAFGVCFEGALLWWLWEAISPAAWLALVAVQGVWFAVLGVLVAAVRGWLGSAWWAAVLWVGFETVRSTWPIGGMPWGRLGFAALDTPWQGWLAWGGVTGAGLIVALLGACAAEVLSRPRWSWWFAGLAALTVAPAILLAVGAGLPSPAVGSARVAVVQGGVPGDGTDVVANHRRVTAAHAIETRSLSRELELQGAGAVDLVLWPENATAVDAVQDAEARAQVEGAARAAGAPLLAGSVSDGPTSETSWNQGVLWSADGVPGQRYTKRHLVPFGEYVPFRPLAARISSRVADIGRDMQPGEVGEPLQVGRLSVADALCFDVAYDDVIAPQVRRGASLVTVQTSNAMFLGTAQLDQQWEITRSRAVETGRSVVVASLNGISGAIDPNGRVVARLPERATVSRVVEVPLATGATPAVLLSAWPARAAVGLTLFVLARLLVQARRESRSRQRASYYVP